MFKRIALSFVGVVAVMYLLVVGAAWADQDQLLYQPDPRLIAPETDGPPIEVVRLTASDGTKLVAWYLPPKGDKPVMLYFSGNAQGLAYQKWRWRRLDKAGVGFLAVGYRGYSGSEGKPSEAGLQRDGEAAYAWVAARYPEQRIVIHGYSLGSGVAVQLATHHPARALILEAPYTSTVDAAKAHYPFLPVGLLMRDRYPSIDRIGQVRMPLLVIHGDRDSVIPYSLGRRLFGAANDPKQFITMEGSDHNTLVRDGLYGYVWRYLNEDAPPGAR